MPDIDLMTVALAVLVVNTAGVLALLVLRIVEHVRQLRRERR